MSGRSPSRVVILTDFANVRGGASGLALRQAEMLAARGIDVVMIAGDSHPVAPKGVDLVSLGGARLLERSAIEAASRGLWDRRVKTDVAEWIDKNDDSSTIYHLHGFQQTLSPSLLAPLRRIANRLVVHAHDYFLACPNGAFFDYRANVVCARAPMSAACLACNCDKNSRAQKIWRLARHGLQNRGFAALAPHCTVVVPRAEMIAPLGLSGRTAVIANPAEAFSTSGIAPEKNEAFVYIGDLNRYKGVLLLAEAARRAGIRVVFIGDGAERETLARDWAEHRITGWQDRSGIAMELRKARMVIAPSLGAEPFGLAPVESLLSGVPVLLASRMLITQEIVSRGAGLEFLSGDTASLSDTLLLAKTRDELVKTLARNAPSAGRSISNSIDGWIDALLDLYSEILFPRSAEYLTAAE